jgi:hypothetical protein
MDLEDFFTKGRAALTNIPNQNQFYCSRGMQASAAAAAAAPCPHNALDLLSLSSRLLAHFPLIFSTKSQVLDRCGIKPADIH